MKVKNIAFSGVMATILLGVGAANAATAAKIASQKYVDDKATQTLTTVSTTYATKESVTEINNLLTNEETGLQAQIDAATATANTAKDTADTAKESADNALSKIGDENSGLTKAIADVDAKAAQNTTDISDLDRRVTKNTDDIAALNEGLDKKVADSIADALKGDGDIKETIDNAIKTAVDELPIGTLTSDVDALKETVGDENSGLVQQVNANTSAIDTLNGDADTAGSVANTVKDLAIPKPDDSCSAESGRCVLSVSTTGDLMWLDVTAPLGE